MSYAGDAGGDTFVFAGVFGRDVIGDFRTGAASEDRVEFHNLFVDYADMLGRATQSGADVVIALDGSNTVTLKGVTLAQLHVDDFVFVNPAASMAGPREAQPSAEAPSATMRAGLLRAEAPEAQSVADPGLDAFSPWLMPSALEAGSATWAEQGAGWLF